MLQLINWLRKKLGIGQFQEDLQFMANDSDKFQWALINSLQDVVLKIDECNRKLDEVSRDVQKIPREIVIKNVLSI
jgi:hypothetical protein